MCIVLVTTAHPSYALIVLDNRDEFILRPTSRPHWWTSDYQTILSSRDQQREEQGTWMGITRSGKFAVLTNYRETDPAAQPAEGNRSRGAMVTAWLTSAEEESTSGFIERLLNGDGLKGVGGFSLLCGRLRKKYPGPDVEALAIISNRSDSANAVPWIASERGQVYGLSNSAYVGVEWPKVRRGKDLLQQEIEQAVAANEGEEELVDRLFHVLDTDLMPKRAQGESDVEYMQKLRHSIFIPAIGKTSPSVKAEDIASGMAEDDGRAQQHKECTTASEPRHSIPGVYGTQRQTIMLVDWNGTVVFKERALWDDEGRAISRGSGDVEYRFQIEGWQDS